MRRKRQNFGVGYDYSVQYVAESSTFPSMAASAAMMLGYRDGGAPVAHQVLNRFADCNLSPDNPNDIDRLAYPLTINVLSDACHGPADWAKALERGPVMVGTTSRVILVAGVVNEYEGDSAKLKIVDPGMGGETWMGFDEVKQRYEIDPAIYQVKLLQW